MAEAVKGGVVATVDQNDEINALIGTPTKYGDDKSFDLIAAPGWLPRVQLMNGSSDLVKEGKAQVGRWFLIWTNDKYVDLGQEVNIWIFAWRPKALDLSDKGAPVSHYNQESEGFKATMLKADEKDSGCMFGPEFLVYLPDQASFAGLMMGSKTARREAGNLRALLDQKKHATLKSHYIKGPKFSWHGPVVTQCSATLNPPDLTILKEQIAKFASPPDEQTELAPADDTPPEEARER